MIRRFMQKVFGKSGAPSYSKIPVTSTPPPLPPPPTSTSGTEKNVEGDITSLPNVVPSHLFIQTIDKSNHAWITHALDSPLHLPKPTSSSSSSTINKETIPIHVYGTSHVNLPLRMNIPFSRNQKWIYGGSVLVDRITNKYETIQEMNTMIGNRIGFVVDEDMDWGTWLIGVYAGLVRRFGMDDGNGNVSNIGMTGNMDSVMGVLGISSNGNTKDINIWKRATITVDDWLNKIRAFCLSHHRDLIRIGNTGSNDDEKGIPSTWITTMQSTGLIPCMDTVMCMDSVAVYRRAYVDDRVMVKVCPSIVDMRLCRSDHDTNDDDMSDIVKQKLVNKYDEWCHRLSLNHQSSTMDLKSRIADIYKHVGVSSYDLMRINTGDMVIDGILQRICLDPVHTQVYMGAIAKTVMCDGHGEMGDKGSELNERIRETCKRAQRIKMCVEDMVESGDVDVVCVVADRSVASVLSLMK